MHAPTAESKCSCALAEVSVAPRPSGSSNVTMWLRMYAFALSPPCQVTLDLHGPFVFLTTSGFVFISLTKSSILETSSPFRFLLLISGVRPYPPMPFLSLTQRFPSSAACRMPSPHHSPDAPRTFRNRSLD